LAHLLDTASKFAMFLVFGLKDENLTKRQTYMKTKHANSILESFEHLSQMSRKSVLIISSYTISMSVQCFEDTV